MRAPGQALTASGGDYILLGVWLKPEQIDELGKHSAAALARREGDPENHLAWLRDLNRVVTARSAHLRAGRLFMHGEG